MRLIDADELHNALANFYDDIDDKNEVIMLSKSELLSYVDDHPSVDAIPVDFIEKKIEECGSNRIENPTITSGVVLRTLINEWRKKNDSSLPD